MKIINAKINWMDEYDNQPELLLLVDKLPSYENRRYEQKGDLYWSEVDGIVSFFYYRQPGEGYSGRKFDITLKDGTKKTLIGPWSSSASAMNSAGFPRCKEVAITDDKELFSGGRGGCYYSYSILEELYKKAIEEFCLDAHWLYVVSKFNGCPDMSDEQNVVITIGIPPKTDDVINKDIVIARKGMDFEQSQKFKNAKRSLKIIEGWYKKDKPYYYKDEYWNNLYKSHVDGYNEKVKEYNLEQFGLNLIIM